MPSSLLTFFALGIDRQQQRILSLFSCHINYLLSLLILILILSYHRIMLCFQSEIPSSASIIFFLESWLSYTLSLPFTYQHFFFFA